MFLVSFSFVLPFSFASWGWNKGSNESRSLVEQKERLRFCRCIYSVGALPGLQAQLSDTADTKTVHLYVVVSDSAVKEKGLFVMSFVEAICCCLIL